MSTQPNGFDDDRDRIRQGGSPSPGSSRSLGLAIRCAALSLAVCCLMLSHSSALQAQVKLELAGNLNNHTPTNLWAVLDIGECTYNAISWTFSWTKVNNGVTTVSYGSALKETLATGSTLTLKALCPAAAHSATVGPVTIQDLAIAGGGVYCAGAAVSLVATGHHLAFLTWTKPDGSTSGSNQVNFTMTAAAAGNYSCTVTKDGQTTPNVVATVTLGAVPTAPTGITASTSSYCAGSAPANVTLTATGGTGTTIRWMTGACGGTTVGAGNPLVITPAPTATTTYFVRRETACGNSTCVNTTITVNTATTPTITADAANPVCTGTSVTLDAGAGYSSYLWSTGATTRTVSVSQNTAGTFNYNVTVTNANGCTATDPDGYDLVVEGCAIDLTASAIGVSNGDCETGKNPELTATVNNSGGKDAGSFKVAFYDGAPGTGTLLGKTTVSSLAANSNTDVTFTLGSSTFQSTSTIQVQVDSDAEVGETDETNNALNSGNKVSLPMPIIYALDEMEKEVGTEKPWQLIRFDMRTNTKTIIGKVKYSDNTTPYDLESMGYNPGAAFAYSGRSVDPSTEKKQKVIKINLVDAIAEDVSSNEVGCGNLDGMNVMGDGKLYAVHTNNQSTPYNGLMDIDKSTGVGTRLMNLGHKFEGLAETKDGWLLATKPNGTLYRIDAAKKTQTLIGYTYDHNDGAKLYSDIEALECIKSTCAINPATFGVPAGDDTWSKHGYLLGYTDQGNKLLLINPETAKALPLALKLDSGTTDIEGMVSVSESDDPAMNAPSAGLVSMQISGDTSIIEHARWRLTTGADTEWKRSGEVVRGLAAGSYTLEFKAVEGWNQPSAMTVWVSEGELSSATAEYGEEDHDQ